MSCPHRFGHPSLADDDCLPCELPLEHVGHVSAAEGFASVGWSDGHPWDRVVEATEPTVRGRVLEIINANTMIGPTASLNLTGALELAGLLVSEPEPVSADDVTPPGCTCDAPVDVDPDCPRHGLSRRNWNLRGRGVSVEPADEGDELVGWVARELALAFNKGAADTFMYDNGAHAEAIVARVKQDCGHEPLEDFVVCRYARLPHGTNSHSMKPRGECFNPRLLFVGPVEEA